MPPGLTYPSLKCVFEFLEANKRIHITSRNSNLKTIDKLVPLHLKMLQIDGYLIMVNNVAYRVLDVNLLGNDFGRVFYKPQYWIQIPRGYFPIFYQKNGTGNTSYEYENRRGKIFRRRANKDFRSVTSHLVIRQLLESLFVGRRVIIVEKLVTGWLQPESQKLELKFNVLEMESEGYDLKDFVPLIDPRSFPLRKLTQKPYSFSFLELSPTANHLVINNFFTSSFDAINFLKSVNCKYIEIKDIFFNENYISDTIQMMLENHRDVETCYMIDLFKWTSEYTRNLMERIKERFKGRDVDFMDADKRSTLTSQYVSIPIDSRTELAVYRNESLKECREIVIMEVILTGHSRNVFRLDYSKSGESFVKKYSHDESEDDRSPVGESNEDELSDNASSDGELFEDGSVEDESRENESPDDLKKTASEKFKMPITSLPITYILIVVLFAWFFFL
ncbi:hypothetical protein GCK72_007254 [Caenorhabditis remanei]|uniref:F-box domain-containing protein n=1 Tax=Caenorhabditis remanei TaxID=31234 RepID=A0A6A5HIL0_CAERE|nr:hypothetical protein GCK72_007254 [Caenorhabditis remanei]KAF1767295.1 hypothetical protein GCK72_007254 [Caenorhabditis remanei]